MSLPVLADARCALIRMDVSVLSGRESKLKVNPLLTRRSQTEDERYVMVRNAEETGMQKKRTILCLEKYNKKARTNLAENRENICYCNSIYT